MTLPDINLLVYAYNADAPHHEAAKAWLVETLNGPGAVGLPWAVVCGFVRIVTHPRVFAEPMSAGEALACVNSWLALPNVDVLTPGPRHLQIMQRLLGEAGVAGSLTTDAHLAAMAIEHQCTLASNDLDFSRFSGLRRHNPLV